jgi:hypothetical protein
MTVFLAMLAYSGYRYWQENRESGVTPAPVAGSYEESVQGASWDDIPQQEAIAVVGTTSGEQSAAAATAPDTAAEVAAQPGTTATDGLAAIPATEEPDRSATTAIPWKPDTGAAQPAAEVAPPPAEPAETETAEPAELTTSEPPPKPAAVANQPARPAQPQPGYGYYPPQPNWQQPYYQPGYPQQYPAR